MSMLSYFRAPFPSAQGFSAYRFPGAMVHLPFLLGSTFLGFLLCWPHLLLRPLLAVWVVAGLYLGRDFAIFCHYAPFLVLLVWGAVALLVAKAHVISAFAASHPLTAAAISLLLAALFLAQVWRYKG
jgi:hypothetical protein